MMFINKIWVLLSDEEQMLFFGMEQLEIFWPVKCLKNSTAAEKFFFWIKASNFSPLFFSVEKKKSSESKKKEQKTFLTFEKHLTDEISEMAGKTGIKCVANQSLHAHLLDGWRHWKPIPQSLPRAGLLPQVVCYRFSHRLNFLFLWVGNDCRRSVSKSKRISFTTSFSEVIQWWKQWAVSNFFPNSFLFLMTFSWIIHRQNKFFAKCVQHWWSAHYRCVQIEITFEASIDVSKWWVVSTSITKPTLCLICFFFSPRFIWKWNSGNISLHSEEQPGYQFIFSCRNW